MMGQRQEEQDGDEGGRVGLQVGLQSDQVEDKSSALSVMEYGRGGRVFLAGQW